ncbi:hypothetical protein PG994_002323 [Apiospora phragmitis]|uniref:Uncharacterized protein n=1 Tax=Apiospora phragmitis TaxID=2905665 RepID=A0ABR1WW47_9PEZI
MLSTTLFVLSILATQRRFAATFHYRFSEGYGYAQSTTGAIAFDYTGYAETRLAEFTAWSAEDDGSRSGALEMPLREAQWAMAYLGAHR